MGFFRKLAIKQVAKDHVYGISQVLVRCRRDFPQVPKREWAEMIVKARYDEPGEEQVRSALLEQLQKNEINDFLHFMIMTLVAEGKLDVSGIIKPQVKRDWQQYILDEYGKYGISINEATEHWG